MFKFFKDKLKNAVSKFSKDVDEKTEVIEDEPVEEEPTKKSFLSKIFGKKEEEPEEKVEDIPEEVEEKIEEELEKLEDIEKIFKEPKKKEEIKEFLDPIKEEVIEPMKKEVEETPLVTPKEEIEKEEQILEEVEEDLEKDEVLLEKPVKKTIFGKIKEAITKKSLSDKEFDDMFSELELVLLESNVAVEVINKIKADLKKELVDSKVLRGKVKDIIETTLKNSLIEILTIKTVDVLEQIKKKKPFIIVFVGINGTGKTTTLAKFANMLTKNNLTSVMAAADTFRAAAIQQLEEHADKLNIKMIKHDYGSDPAAVAFDAVKYAEAKNIDVVLIDTAGRQHSNTNLMDELKKIIRVSKPDMKIFIGDSLTGNDCVEQATQFDKAIGIDANILTKVDVDEKGGAALSISYVTGKPIIYIGSGQGYDNLERFDHELILERMGF